MERLKSTSLVLINLVCFLPPFLIITDPLAHKKLTSELLNLTADTKSIFYPAEIE